MDWLIGLDLGTNSIGWWAYKVEKVDSGWNVGESLDGGVLLFPDGREPSSAGRIGDSRAVARRMARGMRRNRDHGRNRIRLLVKDLTESGLLPEDAGERRVFFQPVHRTKGDPERYNPYRLRSEALERALKPHELGRALFHLGLRRGFKSTRRESSDEDGGALKDGIEALRERLGAQTLGRFLWRQHGENRVAEAGGENRPGIRFRGEHDLYPERAMTEAEFDAIRAHQEPHHDLTPKDWERLRGRILFQHPLRPVERGACAFFPDHPRHYRDTPIGHDFRLYQEINNLSLVDRDQKKHPLDREQRDGVLNLLITRKSDVTFKSMRKLKRGDGTPMFGKDLAFNLEGENRKGLKVHKFAAAVQSDGRLRDLWARRAEGDPAFDDAIEFLHETADPDAALRGLRRRFGLDDGTAAALSAIKLSIGTANVSRHFMERIVPVLRDQGLVYSDAVAQLRGPDGDPLHHSLLDDGRRFARLPYYGEVMPNQMLGADPAADPDADPEGHYGRINNPTVHVALNQLRRLMNALIERFGAGPVEVRLELTRDLKLPKKKREEIQRRQMREQRENERIREFCADHGFPEPTARDIKKVKLWEELGEGDLVRRCVYTGDTISAAQVFNGEAEIEHILPFSRTLDDTLANMTLSLRRANRVKGDKTPFEAFGQDQHADKGIVWEAVLGRAGKLPGNKKWRFGEDAMARFDERNAGFINRQLTDTAYMTRIAQRYLSSLQTVRQVVPNPGRLTAMVRGKWGLNGILSDDNRKSREDNRHHAVDAAVVGLMDRALLQNISTQTRNDRVHIDIPEPAIDLDAIRRRVPEIVVAVKPDHGLKGKMYKETAYGFVPENRRDPDLPEHNLVARMAFAALTPKQCAAIRDRRLRRLVGEHLDAARAAGGKHDKALIEFAKTHGVRNVRVLVKDQTVEPVPSAPYKGYAPDSYAFCDVWRLPKGKPGKWKNGGHVWQGVYWSYADTVSGDVAKEHKKPHPAARFVTRLFKDDLVSFDDGGGTVIRRVAGFSTTDNRLDIRDPNLADAPRSYVGINVLGKAGLRRLHVTADGCARGPKRRGGAS